MRSPITQSIPLILSTLLLASCSDSYTTQKFKPQPEATPGQKTKLGFSALTAKLNAFINAPVSTSDEGAHSLTNAIGELESGKEVENFAEILATELNSDNLNSTSKKFKAFLSQLEIAQGTKTDDPSINKDKLVIAALKLWLLKNDETLKSTELKDQVESYFSRRLTALAASPEDKSEQMLNGYSGLMSVIEDDKWVMTHFLRSYNRLSKNLPVVLKRDLHKSSFKVFTRVMNELDSESKTSSTLTTAFLENSLAWLENENSILQASKHDRSQSLEQVRSTLNAVDAVSSLFSRRDAFKGNPADEEAITLQTFDASTLR